MHHAKKCVCAMLPRFFLMDSFIDSLLLQEVSSMLLDKLVAAGIGDRPVVFVTHRPDYFSTLCYSNLLNVWMHYVLLFRLFAPCA